MMKFFVGVALLVCFFLPLPNHSDAQQEDPTLTGIIALAWNANGTLLATANTDGTIDIRNATGQITQTLLGHTERVRSVAWNPNDTDMLATGGDDLLIHIWDISAPLTPIHTLSGHSGIIFVLDWSQNGFIASIGIGETRALHIWDTSSWQQIASPLVGSISEFHWNPLGDQFAIAGPPDVVATGLSQSFDAITIFLDEATLPLSVDWHPDGHCLVSSGLDGSIKLWDLENEVPLGTLAQSSAPVWEVAFNPDGTQIAGMQDHQILIWDAKSGQLLESITVSGMLKDIDWNPDGTGIAYGGLTNSGDALFDILYTPAPNADTDNIGNPVSCPL